MIGGLLYELSQILCEAVAIGFGIYWGLNLYDSRKKGGAR